MSTYVSFVPVSITLDVKAGGWFLKLGQTFISGGTSFTLTDVDLCLGTQSNLTGNLLANLYAIDGDGFPTGDSLSSGSIEVDDVNDGIKYTHPVWTNITMSSYVFSGNAAYAIVVSSDVLTGLCSCTLLGNDCWLMYGTSNNNYLSGKAIRYGVTDSCTDTPVWASFSSSWDFAFKINGTIETGFTDASASIVGSGSLVASATMSDYAFCPPKPTGATTWNTETGYWNGDVDDPKRLVACAKDSFFYESV